MSNKLTARICAGVPASNNTLMWKCQFPVGDPVVMLELPQGDSFRSVLIVRDIEMKRAKRMAQGDVVYCPADFTPTSGLSGDRETATAQSAAECLRQEGIKEVLADRSLPLIYVDQLSKAGIKVQCDTELWVNQRRMKTEQEISHLRAAQHTTEKAMEFACQLVGKAEARADGILYHQGKALTSELVRAAIDHFLLDEGFDNPTSIVAGGATGAECHEYGSGELKTGETVIIDIFPQSKTTFYNGDCTRTVVHGDIPDDIVAIHKTVCLAKAAAEKAVSAGVTGEQVHQATIDVILEAGYSIGLPTEDSEKDFCSMTHGTGHGIGLAVHEPPLLDFKGPPLLVGDALTIEPGVYRRGVGGVRVEDMVIVTEDGCINLNKLQEGLTWS